MRLATFPAQDFVADPTLELCLFAVWTQTELIWSLISATIPSLRPFLRGLSTAEGTIFESPAYPDSKQQTSSYMLSNLSKARRGTYRKSRSETAPDELCLRPGYDEGSNSVTVEARPGEGRKAVAQDSISVGSDDSQRMIIRKEVIWTIDAE